MNAAAMVMQTHTRTHTHIHKHANTHTRARTHTHTSPIWAHLFPDNEIGDISRMKSIGSSALDARSVDQTLILSSIDRTVVLPAYCMHRNVNIHACKHAHMHKQHTTHTRACKQYMHTTQHNTIHTQIHSNTYTKKHSHAQK